MADPDSLPVRRVRLFLAQYAAEHGYGWQTRLAALTNRHQTHLGRVSQGKRGPGLEDVAAIVRELGVSERFFYDESLGEAPDYRQFVGENRETRVERDDAAVHPVVEQVLRERHASPEAAARLRAAPLRLFGGTPDPFTVATILSAIEADVRREAGAQAAGREPAPKEPSPVPEGKRRVGSGKRGR